MRLHHRLLIAAAAIVLAGCGSSTPTPASASAVPSVAPPGPTETPSPTASPSASPAAVTIQDVLARLIDPKLAYTGDVTGNVSVGSVSLPVTGKMEYASGDSHTLISIQTPSGPQGSEDIAVGGKHYSRASATAPWFETPPSAAGKALGQAIATIGNVTDKGMTTRNGVSVHHFSSVPGAVPASSLGMDKPGVSGFTSTVDLYTDDSGKLVGIGLTADWQQAGATGAPLPASMTLDFALADTRPTIAPPALLWDRFTSSRFGYSIGYPDASNVVAGKKVSEPDVFGSSADEFYVVVREVQPTGVKLANYVKAYIDTTFKQLKVKPDSQGDLTIDGRPGKVLLYHLKIQGKDRYNVVLMTLDGRNGYTISLVGGPGQEANMNAFADTLLTTFTVTK